MKKYNLYTLIKYQRRYRIEKLIYSVYHWCVDKWGKKEHVYSLSLDITHKEHTWNGHDTQADYCATENEITIYPFNNNNIRDLVDSVIHEFTHQKQDMGDYHVILEKGGYADHPLEKEAVETAKKYRKECWHSIKHIINN